MLEVKIENIIPVTEARDKLNQLIENVEGSDEMIVMTKNGKPTAILVGVHHMEKLTGENHEEVFGASAPEKIEIPQVAPITEEQIQENLSAAEPVKPEPSFSAPQTSAIPAQAQVSVDPPVQSNPFDMPETNMFSDLSVSEEKNPSVTPPLPDFTPNPITDDVNTSAQDNAPMDWSTPAPTEVANIPAAPIAPSSANAPAAVPAQLEHEMPEADRVENFFADLPPVNEGEIKDETDSSSPQSSVPIVNQMGEFEIPTQPQAQPINVPPAAPTAPSPAPQSSYPSAPAPSTAQAQPANNQQAGL